MKWLLPGGYLILHLVDRDNFDPILPPGNPLLYVSPQKYAKKRITTTKVKFDDFSYSADFSLNEKTNIATFNEKFKNDSDGKGGKKKGKGRRYDCVIGISGGFDSSFIVHLLAVEYKLRVLTSPRALTSVILEQFHKLR